MDRNVPAKTNGPDLDFTIPSLRILRMMVSRALVMILVVELATARAAAGGLELDVDFSV